MVTYRSKTPRSFHSHIVYNMARTAHKIWGRILLLYPSHDWVALSKIDWSVVHSNTNTVSPRNAVGVRNLIHLWKDTLCCPTPWPCSSIITTICRILQICIHAHAQNIQDVKHMSKSCVITLPEVVSYSRTVMRFILLSQCVIWAIHCHRKWNGMDEGGLEVWGQGAI